MVTRNAGLSTPLAKDSKTIARFILLRSQGWSFNRIAAELNVSKPTLIKWSRQHQFDIANLRATETEALAERVFRQRHERWELLARQVRWLTLRLQQPTVVSWTESRSTRTNVVEGLASVECAFG